MTEWERKLKLYDSLIAGNSNFKRKGKTVPYTSANGYMFSLLNKSNEIGIRLPKASGEKFKTDFNTTIFKSHGAVMKDYVLVPDSVLDDKETFTKYINESFNHVMSLPSK